MKTLNYLDELNELLDLATKKELITVLRDLAQDPASQFALIEALKAARTSGGPSINSIREQAKDLEQRWNEAAGAQLKLEAEPVYGEDLLVDAPEHFVLTDEKNVRSLIQESEALIHQAATARDFTTAFQLMDLLSNPSFTLTFMDYEIPSEKPLALLERHGLVDEKLETIWLNILPAYLTLSQDRPEVTFDTILEKACQYHFSLAILRPLFETNDFNVTERQNISRGWRDCLIRHQAHHSSDGQEALNQAEEHLPETYTADLL